MLSKLGILTLVFSFSLSALALDLQPLPAPKGEALPIQIGQPPIPCDQIVNRMVKYQQMVSAQENSLTGFLGQVAEKISGWYSQLSPLEGTTQTLTPGSFESLKDGADKIASLSDMAFDNTDLLTQELEHIVGSLRGCSLTPASPATPTLK